MVVVVVVVVVVVLFVLFFVFCFFLSFFLSFFLFYVLFFSFSDFGISAKSYFPDFFASDIMLLVYKEKFIYAPACCYKSTVMKSLFIPISQNEILRWLRLQIVIITRPVNRCW